MASRSAATFRRLASQQGIKRICERIRVPAGAAAAQGGLRLPFNSDNFTAHNLSSICASRPSRGQSESTDSSSSFSDTSSSSGSILAALAALGVGAAVYGNSQYKGVSNCCGIVGYIGAHDVEPILLEGVRILQNRGYDSCGISTLDDEARLHTTKFASKGTTSDCIEILAKEAPVRHQGHKIGIAHTRWATHGGKTDVNAHPHHDYKNRISLAHNGTIENFADLRKSLMEKGIPFVTETDTEVIANLIGSNLDDGLSFEEAVEAAVQSLQGTWGLVILHRDHPDKIVLARNGSPLLVGSSEHGVFVASEASALARHTNSFLTLKDGEIAVVSSQGIDHLKATRQMQQIHLEKIEMTPAPYTHWTLKEIFEQPQSLARALNYGGRISSNKNRVRLGGLDNSKDAMMAIRHLVVSGCGTSLFAGMYGELLMQYLDVFNTVRSLDASEVNSHSFCPEHSGLLLLSQSGETLDTIRACQVADEMGVRRLSVVNVVGSLLARMTNCGVYLNAGREVAVASTKAFTSQVTVLALISAWFGQNKRDSGAAGTQCSDKFDDRTQELMNAIHRLPVYAGMTLDCRQKCKEVAQKIKDARTMFILGKGFGFPVALEGALKIKEISYIHAEGFAGGALKHGPFALLDEAEKTPVVLLVLSDVHAPLMINAAQQVKARGAHLICITDEPNLVEGVADDVIVIPPNGPLTALIAVLPLQLLAYELAIARGINPDKPRGLAKTVTVS